MPKVIFQPLKPFRISQRFGENNACVSLDGKNKVITCNGHNPPNGYKSLYGPMGHKAIDLWANHGQEIYAAADGIVYWVDTHERSGLDVRIEHEVQGVRFRTIYEHLMGYQVTIGQRLLTGELIGWADNTGYSSGNHLHFQMEMWKDNAWVAVDPMLYMENTFALDILKLKNKVKYLKELLARLLDNTASKIRK